MFRAISLVALVLMLVASPLFAKQKAQENVVIADSADKFAVLVEKIRSQMATGQRYEFLSPADRKLVNHPSTKWAPCSMPVARCRPARRRNDDYCGAAAASCAAAMALRSAMKRWICSSSTGSGTEP